MAPENTAQQVVPVARGVGGRFLPGAASPNPGGRPKAEGEVRALARLYTAEAVEGILAIAKDPEAPPQVRLAAWSALLDRGHGRPPVSVAISDDRLQAEQEATHKMAQDFALVARFTADRLMESRRNVALAIELTQAD
jgi:hypothetical protein